MARLFVYFPVNVIPAFRFPHKAADLVQPLAAPALPIAGDEFNDGRCTAGFVTFDLQPESFQFGFIVESDMRRTRRGMPGG